MFRKGLVIVVVVLFIGASFILTPNILIKTVKADLTTELIGYWSFDDGTANDNSGNDHNGIIYGATVEVGISGNAFRFDGDDDCIDFGDDPDFDITSNITISLWFKTNTSQLGIFLNKLDIHNPDNGYSLNIGGTYPNPGETINYWLAKNSANMNYYDTAQTISTFTDDVWHFLTAIYTPDGVSRPKIYIDSIEQLVNYSGIPLTSIGASPGYNLKIAESSYGSGSFNFNGTLDEVRLYNRALTIDEIQYLYDNPGGVDFVYVDDDFNSSTPGWQIDYFDKIQDGVDAVNKNGTVYVYNGTYYENVNIDKNNLDLIGENKKTTIIDGGGDVGLNITSNNTFINGFSINNCTLGISLLYNVFEANNITISNNTIYDCGHGILLVKSNNTYILSNTIFNNSGNSIFIQKCNNSNISNNVFYNNQQNGITIKNSLNCNIFSNNIYNNLDLGISIIDSSQNNLIFKNNIINNLNIGVYISGFSSNNSFYHNNLINNTINAEDECGNIWNDTYPNGGNHWSDYYGEDFYNGPNQDIPGSDGIGDIPYEIPCEHGIDYYPLMRPFELYYFLDVIPENNTINEGTVFNVTIKSLGGTLILDAIVDFNDELKLTDSNGTVWFTAPQVEIDTYYEIKATKTGYTEANETILIKNMPTEFKRTFMCGRYANLFTEEGLLTIDVVNLWTLQFSPFELKQHVPPETMKFSIDYLGIITKQFIFGIFNVVI